MPPLCPKCNKPMIQRTAYKGTPRQSVFWGCVDFPLCKGTRSINIAATGESTPEDKTDAVNDQADAASRVVLADELACVRFESEPIDGFEQMESFETIAGDSSILDELMNENLVLHYFDLYQNLELIFPVPHAAHSQETRLN